MFDRKSDKRAQGDARSERYQVSDPSVLFEDVWAEPGEGGGRGCVEAKQTCPTCGFSADLADIRCPRCNTLLVTGCSGSCGACGSKTCDGGSRKG
jgi:hypothetical protein